MSRPPIDPAIVKAVEDVAINRILAVSDKELLQKFPTLSRSTLHRIMANAREKLERMKKMSQMER